jgi:ribonuclease Z
MKFEHFDIDGFSLGGVETAVVIPQWRLAIDVGRARKETLRSEHVALTHVHMDHAGGLAYLVAMRAFYNLAPPTIYVPAQSADALDQMLRTWDRLQKFETAYTIVPVETGARYRLRRDLHLVPFRTHHVVPSFGYTVESTTHRLKKAFEGRPGPELKALRMEGTEITQPHIRRLLAVTGDTLPEVLDRHPDLYGVEVLLMECTFLDDRKPYEAAREGGHVHLKDLMARASQFANDTLVLSHFSQLYTDDDIHQALQPLAEIINPTLRTLPQRYGGLSLTFGEPEVQ